MAARASNKQIESAKRIFRRHDGILKTGEALDEGIHRRTLYTMRDTGILERLERGLYRLADLPPLSNPDLVTVARKIPQAVICLISALHFYNITTANSSCCFNRGESRHGTATSRLPSDPDLLVFW